MKKLLAIVLALMLVTASAAFAETATVFTFSNPVITATQGDQTNTADLTGTNLTIAMGMAGEEPAVTEDGEIVDNRVPTVQLDIVKDGENLLSGEIQVINERLVMNLQGMSRPVAADMSVAGGIAGQGYKTMFEGLPEMAKTKLPAFQGVTIPKLDLMSVASFLPMLGVQAETTENSASFEIPAEMVNMLLSMLIDQVPEQALQLFGGADALNQMLSSGGFALKGNITDDAETAALELGIHPVAEGATAEEAFLTITFASEENSDTLSVDISMGDESMNLGQLALNSIPDEAELDLGLNLMNGQMSLTGSLYPQEGAQVAALELNIPGQKMNASLMYGENEGMDYADFAIAVENQSAIDLYVQTTGDGNGNEDGTCTVTVDGYGETPTNVVVEGEISQRVVEDFGFRSIANAANALDIAQATEEEQQQLNQEINEIMGKLTAALSVIAPAA